ncbi:hypothetical protein DNTS_006099 [Danionella cerebrum]|uniref:Immunoglobulin V-set domain-containing protein n=1 Tax=Danionella cerebrum TaxID=2873325 RepID=A0A553QN69_9TELE|nr:hypothetical protein DNTS_006099 [Danionella translucida]
MMVTEGSTVNVYLGGNTTLPCSLQDNTEIFWIGTNGNQAFVTVMSLLFILDGPIPEPSEIHPQYKGRTKAFSSSTNTHSLLLMNITEADLMLYCCMDFQLKQHNCTKLDIERNRNG